MPETKKTGPVDEQKMSWYVEDRYAGMGLVSEIWRYGAEINRSPNAVLTRIVAKATQNGKKGALAAFFKDGGC